MGSFSLELERVREERAREKRNYQKEIAEYGAAQARWDMAHFAIESIEKAQRFGRVKGSALYAMMVQIIEKLQVVIGPIEFQDTYAEGYVQQWESAQGTQLMPAAKMNWML